MKKLFALIFSVLLSLPTLAQREPKKPLDLPALKQAIDSLSLSAELSLNFNFTTTEVRGEIETKEQIKTRNDKRRQEVEQQFKQKPTDLKLAMEFFQLSRDTTEQFAQGTICLGLLEAKIKESPQNGELYYEAGRIFQSVYRYEQALEQYGYAQKLMPDSAKVYQKAGELYFYSRKYTQAKELFTEALRLDNSLLDLHLYYITTDVFNSMVELTQKGETESKSAMLEWAGTLKQDLEKLEKAIQKYASRKDLADFKCYARFFWLFYKGFMLGVTLNKDLDFTKRTNMKLSSVFKIMDSDTKELKTLEKEFLKLIKDKNLKNPALAYEALGVIALMEGDDKKAIQYLKQVAKLNPEKLANYQNIAFIYFMQKEDKKVEEYLRQKIKIEKKPSDYTAIAAVHEYSKNYEKAKSICKEGISAFAGSPTPEIHHTFAVLQAITGNYAEASTLYAKALQGMSESNDAYKKICYGYALVELMQKNWESAYSLLKKGAAAGQADCPKLLAEYFE